MAETIDNLMLEYLKRFQTTLDKIERRLAELTVRQSDTHSAVLGVRRDQIHDAETAAHLQVQVDGLNDRLDRIERRLELNS